MTTSDGPEAGPDQIGLSRRVARFLARVYYRKIEVDGREHCPVAGPLLVVANHPNSLLDPAVLAIALRRPMRFLAKATLFDIPVFGSLLRAVGMLPAYRGSDDAAMVSQNTATLASAAQALIQGDAIGIFPEGKTHDALRVEQVKSGAARIAVQAWEGGARNLRILAVGLNYERKEKFRSVVWVNVSEPIAMSAWMERFPDNPKVAMRQLTNELAHRLKKVAIHLDEAKWQNVFDDIDAFVSPVGGSPLAGLRQRKRVAEAMNHIGQAEPELAAALGAEIERHQEQLRLSGLNARSAVLQYRRSRLFFHLVGQTLFLLVGPLLALLATLHHLVPFVAVRGLTSLTKLPGRSTISLNRLGLGLPIYLVWYVVVWNVLASYRTPLFATLWSLAMPPAGVFALAYWQKADAVWTMWRQQLRALRTRRTVLAELRRQHDELEKRLAAVAAPFRAARSEP